MTKKNTLSILENIKKKLNKFDEPKRGKIGEKNFSDVGDEFEYIDNASDTEDFDIDPNPKVVAQEKPKVEHDIILEHEIENSFPEEDLTEENAPVKSSPAIEEEHVDVKSEPVTAHDEENEVNFDEFEEIDVDDSDEETDINPAANVKAEDDHDDDEMFADLDLDEDQSVTEKNQHEEKSVMDNEMENFKEEDLENIEEEKAAAETLKIKDALPENLDSDKVINDELFGDEENHDEDVHNELDSEESHEKLDEEEFHDELDDEKFHDKPNHEEIHDKPIVENALKSEEGLEKELFAEDDSLKSNTDESQHHDNLDFSEEIAKEENSSVTKNAHESTDKADTEDFLEEQSENKVDDENSEDDLDKLLAENDEKYLSKEAEEEDGHLENWAQNHSGGGIDKAGLDKATQNHDQIHDATKSMLKQESMQKASDSMKKLIEAKSAVANINSFTKGENMSEIAMQLLEPRLEKWLNENLPSLVERIVKEEIDRIMPK